MGTKRNKLPAKDDPIGATRYVGTGAMIYRTLTADVLQIDLSGATLDAIKRGDHVLLTVNATDMTGALYEKGQMITAALSIREATVATPKGNPQ